MTRFDGHTLAGAKCISGEFKGGNLVAWEMEMPQTYICKQNADLLTASSDLLALTQELREAAREMRTWIINNTDAVNSPTFVLDRADIALAHASAILDAKDSDDAHS